MSEVTVKAMQKAKPNEFHIELIRAVGKPLNRLSLFVLTFEVVLGVAALLCKLSELHLFNLLLMMAAIMALYLTAFGMMAFRRLQRQGYL